MASIQTRHVNPTASQLGLVNAVLSGTSRRHHVPEFEGCLSIKSVVTGSAAWQVGSRRFLVQEDCFLILNDRQPYSLSIQSAHPTTTFCLFFARGFVEDVWRATIFSDCTLLDEPDRSPNEPAAGFFERLEPAGHPALQKVRRFQQTIRAVGSEAADHWEDHFLGVANELVQSQRGVLRAAECLPARRASTREELCKRLLRGRDLLLTSWRQPPSLRELAAAACLSPYHFHRSFARLFGRTPHAFLTNYRLEQIAAQLCRSDRGILELCLDAGFQSPASFSSLFSRRFGQSPSVYRRAHRAGSHKFARSEKKVSGEAA